jgi:hypothetical protein
LPNQDPTIVNFGLDFLYYADYDVPKEAAHSLINFHTKMNCFGNYICNNELMEAAEWKAGQAMVNWQNEDLAIAVNTIYSKTGQSNPI